jgi:hypothetical protein
MSRNVTRQTCMIGRNFRDGDEPANIDILMNPTSWPGARPGPATQQLDDAVDKPEEFFGLDS